MAEMGGGGVAVSGQELPEIARYEGRGGDATSCHEIQNNGRNEGTEKGGHELPLAVKRWRSWGFQPIFQLHAPSLHIAAPLLPQSSVTTFPPI